MTATHLTQCTCGECHAGRDSAGNLDYGQEWNEDLGDYTPRECEVARLASDRECSVDQLVVEGWVK